MRLSLKTALSWNFVLLASLPILIAGLIATRYLSTSIEKEISDKNLLLANAYASELNRFLSNSLNRLEHQVHLLEAGTILSPEKFSQQLALEVSSDDGLEMIRVLDRKGIVTHLAPFDQNIFGLDMSRQEYCVKANERQSAYWSNVFISPQTGASTLVLAIPFNKGMVVGHLLLSAVHEIINSINITAGGYAAVLDRNGITIAHPNLDLVAQRANLSNHHHIREGLAGHQGTYRYIAEGQSQIGSIALVPETGWVVAVSQPLDEIFAPVKDLKHIFYAGTILALLTASLAAFLSLQKMLSPLKKLTQNAEKLTVGNYSLVPVPTSFSEITLLSQSFVSMIEKIGSREISLRESEERFRATFEQAAVGIAHISVDGYFLRLNQKFCDIVGYSLEEMTSKTFQEITHPDDLDKDLDLVSQLLKGEADSYNLEKRYLRKNSSFVWVNLTVKVIRDSYNTPNWFVSVVEDISKRKKAEESLQDSEKKFRHLVEQSPLAIQIISPDGRMKLVNEAFKKLWGISDEALPEVMDKYNIFKDVEAEKLGVMSFIEKAFNGVPVTLPVVDYDASGTMDAIGISSPATVKRSILVRMYPIKDSQGKTTSVVQIEEDITDKIMAEQKIYDYQKRLKALASQLTIVEENERSRLAADLHDHICQALVFCRIQLSSLQEQAADEKLKTTLDETSQTLLQIIKSTKDLVFDLSSPLLHQIGLAAATSQWLSEQIGKKHGLETEFSDNCQTRIDGNEIRAVLFRNVRELLANVVKHAYAKRVKVSFAESQGNVEITIEDNGIGFDFNHVAKLVSSQTGFGIFSIQERMENFGGSLEIQSAPGKGCKAILRVPVNT